MAEHHVLEAILICSTKYNTSGTVAQLNWQYPTIMSQNSSDFHKV